MVEKLAEQDSYFEHIAENAELLATKAELQATEVELQNTKAKLQETKVKLDDGVDPKAKQQSTKRQDEFDQKGKPPTQKTQGGDHQIKLRRPALALELVQLRRVPPERPGQGRELLAWLQQAELTTAVLWRQQDTKVADQQHQMYR